MPKLKAEVSLLHSVTAHNCFLTFTPGALLWPVTFWVGGLGVWGKILIGVLKLLISLIGWQLGWQKGCCVPMDCGVGRCNEVTGYSVRGLVVAGKCWRECMQLQGFCLRSWFRDIQMETYVHTYRLNTHTHMQTGNWSWTESTVSSEGQDTAVWTGSHEWMILFHPGLTNLLLSLSLLQHTPYLVSHPLSLHLEK